MKRLALVGLLLMVCSSVSGAWQVAGNSQTPKIDISPAAQASGPPHAMTLDEIVSFRVPREPRRSPDGTRVAFLVDQAFRSCDCNRTALYVVSTAPGSRPRKLLEEASLSSIGWTPDGKSITYLSAKSGSQQLWRIDPGTGSAEQVFTHFPGADQSITRIGYHPGDTTPVGVSTYQWSPDGKHIAFTSSPPIDKAELSRLDKDGILFGPNMDAFTLLTQQWIRVPVQLWVYDLEKKSEKLLWEDKVTVFGNAISSVAWSPDSKRVAFAYSAPPKLKESMVYWNQDVGFVELATGTFVPVGTGEAAEMQPKWSPDGKYLAYISILGYTNSPLVVYELATAKKRELAPGSNARDIWWLPGSNGLIYETALTGKRRTRTGLFRVELNGKTQRVTAESDHIEDCDGTAGMEAVCVWQSSNIPPNPAVVSLETGKPRALADVNPQMKDITVGHVSEMRWTNKYGSETTGYLIKPYPYTPGKKYPLLVMLYGFEGKFVTQAEWLSSYPAQTFASQGFAVLMTNYPPYDEWKGKDFARGSVAEAYSPLASIEAGVNLVVKSGLADPARVGIMGISYGGFLTEFAITHSKMFQVSSLVDGGGHGPAAYAISGYSSRQNDERILGGPPSGATLQNWLSFSPPMMADKVMGPVLMGFNNHEAFYGLEMKTALVNAGVPVEFWVYPGDGHIFTEPEHRYISMERNLDWFNFWLQNREDPDPAKRDQYLRWREMRKQQNARLANMAHGEAAGSE